MAIFLACLHLSHYLFGRMLLLWQRQCQGLDTTNLLMLRRYNTDNNKAIKVWNGTLFDGTLGRSLMQLVSVSVSMICGYMFIQQFFKCRANQESLFLWKNNDCTTFAIAEQIQGSVHRAPKVSFPLRLSLSVQLFIFHLHSVLYVLQCLWSPCGNSIFSSGNKWPPSWHLAATQKMLWFWSWSPMRSCRARWPFLWVWWSL